jgi:molybdate transport system substrate-binding protein
MPKMVYGESVRQVLDYVSREEAQAGFVYSTDAQQGGGKVKVLETLSGKTPVLYPIALLQGSKNQGEAKKFVDFVLSAEGQAILAKYGFSAP